MSMDRRKFLKLAGISSLVGISGLGSFELMRPGWLEAAEEAAQPASGVKRLAMIMDMGKFEEENYKQVVHACHSIHNVPNFGNPKDEIKWIWTDSFEHVFPSQGENPFLKESIEERPFLLLCNHCQHPPCVRVCPTQATFKRKQDGIVAMDYHRCIGCRFCMAACPYGSRSFNWRDPRTDNNKYLGKLNPEFPTRTKGVVEKCNFCVERLAKGLQPNCVESQKGNPGAMYFGDLNDPNSEVREVLNKNYTLRRKPELGTQPNVYYIIGGV